MARALITCALVALLGSFAGVTRAEDGGVIEPRVRVVRPPEGSLRRGALAVPGWSVGVAGGALVLAAAGVLVWRASRR